MREVLTHGACSDDVFQEFVRAEGEARFLFGSDVRDYLQTLRDKLSFINIFTADVIRADPDKAEKFKKRAQTITSVSKFFSTGLELFAPYIRLDQKHTPFWRP